MSVGPSFDRPCRHWLPLDDGTEGYCGETPTRRYLTGDRCMMHTPAALNMRPENRPDPALSLSGLRAAAGLPEQMHTPSSPTIVDTRAIASGKRRSSPEDYRAAQAAVERP